MKEKKQTNKLSYSVFGKYFRGFLCLITFCAFCVSAMLTIDALGTYGTDLLVNPAPTYEETDEFEAEVQGEMSHILNNCNILAQADMPDGEMKILDMSDQKIHHYKKAALGEAIYYDQFAAGYLKDLEKYEQGEAVQIKDVNLLDYEQMKAYLSDSDYPCDYVYFDKESFRKLFENDGLQNVNHRFSEKFSEHAYFVFEDYEIIRKEKIDDGGGTIEIPKEVFTTEENATTEINEEKEAATVVENATTETEDLEEYELATGEEGSAIVNKEIVTQTEIVITPSNLTSYAVYDPEQKLYYSTADEYFSEMETYIYKADEVLTFIESGEAEGNQYNSLVMPLLRSYNTSLYDVANSTYDSFAVTIDAKNTLVMEESQGIYYYLRTDVDCVYANVQEEEWIKNIPNYYRFVKDSKGNILQEHSSNLSDLKDLYVVEEHFAKYPTASVFYLAFDTDVQTWNNGQHSIVSRIVEYPFYKNYITIFLIVAMVTFLLLVVQTIWLICTTGRTYKGDIAVSLNFFDRFYTEIWAIITGFILFASGLFAYCVMEEAAYSVGAVYIASYTAVAAIIFGFCFMILALSLVRRIKAHNLWNQMLLVKLVKYIVGKYKSRQNADRAEGEDKEHHQPSAVEKVFAKLWNGCKEAIYSIKGTRKLLLIFVIFMLVEIVVVFAALDSVQHQETAFFIFMVLQAMALVGVMWVIKDIDKLADGVNEITKGNLDSKVEINEKMSVFGELADGINHIGDGLKSAVETSLKDERMKTELITNVSHDLKTPLTSIINYVDLLKKQDMPNEEAKHYVEVLDGKAQRLKQLTEDLVEAAKATSGNIELEMMPITFDELMKQALGEFEDKYEKKNLTIIASYPKEPAVVLADGRRLFRIIENVLQNIYKYAMEGTRVYADLSKDEEKVTFTLKNVSAAPLNISAEELMERFTRGDSSRTTEGSGLGLSIAKDLTRLQNGEFEIQLDGDLFKVIISFPVHK